MYNICDIWHKAFKITPKSSLQDASRPTTLTISHGRCLRDAGLGPGGSAAVIKLWVMPLLTDVDVQIY